MKHTDRSGPAQTGGRFVSLIMSWEAVVLPFAKSIILPTTLVVTKSSKVCHLSVTIRIHDYSKLEVTPCASTKSPKIKIYVSIIVKQTTNPTTRGV